VRQLMLLAHTISFARADLGCGTWSPTAPRCVSQ